MLYSNFHRSILSSKKCFTEHINHLYLIVNKLAPPRGIEPRFLEWESNVLAARRWGHFKSKTQSNHILRVPHVNIYHRSREILVRPKNLLDEYQSFMSQKNDQFENQINIVTIMNIVHKTLKVLAVSRDIHSLKLIFVFNSYIHIN